MFSDFSNSVIEQVLDKLLNKLRYNHIIHQTDQNTVKLSFLSCDNKTQNVGSQVLQNNASAKENHTGTCSRDHLAGET